MTRILEIVGTDIKLEIEDCEKCPFHAWDEAPPTEWCGLTGRYILAWVRGDSGHLTADGYRYHNERLDPMCPLPTKPGDCPKCGGRMRSVFGLYDKCTKCSYPVFQDESEVEL